MHTALAGTPLLCMHTPAGQCMSEHPCFELIPALAHHRNILLGKQPPGYLGAAGVTAQLLRGILGGINVLTGLCQCLDGHSPGWTQDVVGAAGSGAARGSCL